MPKYLIVQHIAVTHCSQTSHHDEKQLRNGRPYPAKYHFTQTKQHKLQFHTTIRPIKPLK